MENLERHPDPVATRQNRDALKTAAIALHNAFPDWTCARIAAHLNVGKTTVWRMLNEDEDGESGEPCEQQPTPKLPGTTRKHFDANGHQLTIDAIEGINQPSRAFGTAPSTASIINEREALAALRKSAYQVQVGAKAFGKAVEQFDALLKAAYVKGTQAAKDMEL